jgi:hypothetical protein
MNINYLKWDKLEKDEEFKEETRLKILNLVKKKLIIEKSILYKQLDDEFWEEHSDLDKEITTQRMSGGFHGYIINVIEDLLIEGSLLLYDKDRKIVKNIGGYKSVYWKDMWEEYPDNYFNIMHYNTPIVGHFGIPHNSFMFQLTMGKIIGRNGILIAKKFAEEYHFYYQYNF